MMSIDLSWAFLRRNVLLDEQADLISFKVVSFRRADWSFGKLLFPKSTRR